MSLGTAYTGRNAPPLLLFKKQPGSSRARQAEPGSGEHAGDACGRILVCTFCGQPVTRPEARMDKDGSHLHVFCNPHGVVFEVGCFAFAAGLVPLGEASTEFSWFPGYAWQIVNCARCDAHLGWRFTSGGSGFFGLLPARLQEREE